MEGLTNSGFSSHFMGKYRNRTDLTVVQVHAVPRFAEVGCTPERQFKSIKQLYTIFKGNATVTQRYAEEVDRLAGLIRHIPGLVLDFQVMVQPDGSIVHFDLDRWEGIQISRKMVDSCICHLKKDAVLLSKHDFLRNETRTKGTRIFKHVYQDHPEFFDKIPECRKKTTQKHPQNNPIKAKTLR